MGQRNSPSRAHAPRRPAQPLLFGYFSYSVTRNDYTIIAIRPSRGRTQADGSIAPRNGSSILNNKVLSLYYTNIIKINSFSVLV